MKTFPCSLGKETLSNLDQIHLAPRMFSPLLRLTSWKAFLKQDYRRNKGENQISVCVLHHCSLWFFFVGGSHVLYRLREQDVLGEGKKKIRM